MSHKQNVFKTRNPNNSNVDVPIIPTCAVSVGEYRVAMYHNGQIMNEHKGYGKPLEREWLEDVLRRHFQGSTKSGS